MIKFLVFRKKEPQTCLVTFMDMRSVAKFLGKSISYVHSICLELKSGKHLDEVVDTGNDG